MSFAIVLEAFSDFQHAMGPLIDRTAMLDQSIGLSFDEIFQTILYYKVPVTNSTLYVSATAKKCCQKFYLTIEVWLYMLSCRKQQEAKCMQLRNGHCLLVLATL